MGFPSYVDVKIFYICKSPVPLRSISFHRIINQLFVLVIYQGVFTISQHLREKICADICNHIA